MASGVGSFLHISEWFSFCPFPVPRGGAFRIWLICHETISFNFSGKISNAYYSVFVYLREGFIEKEKEFFGLMPFFNFFATIKY
jgi:hypothetical protein